MRVIEPGEAQPPEREEWEQDVLDAIPDPPRRKVGRPSKRTPERALVIISALREGGTREGAAADAGMHRQTLWDWTQDAPELVVLMENAERFAQMDMLRGIRRAGNATWQALAWMLERRWPQEFARREKTDITIETKRYVTELAEKHGLDEGEIMARVGEILAAGQTAKDE